VATWLVCQDRLGTDAKEACDTKKKHLCDRVVRAGSHSTSLRTRRSTNASGQKKTKFFVRFFYRKLRFAKTGSGQTSRNLSTKAPFNQCVSLYAHHVLDFYSYFDDPAMLSTFFTLNHGDLR
jgi:hypothetical protein